MKKTELFKLLAKTGYFGLLVLIPAWHLWLSPPALGISPWLVAALWFIPLLFPLKGIIQNNPYTYAWSAFVALLYLMHSMVILLTDPAQSLLAVIELLLTCLFLSGNIYFAKYRGQELGLNIRKKKAAQEK
ncbi:DUF2069 domain-containing protein [Psychromonas ossibalaenae]|uniref:DUF2069 domain-containing protein n=1 Tax=Psychromonas ossibalaenae TaxID=444922 RepID=UPI00035F4FFF|nr:DUF2069 domain-containing protein [Psychromonas ossibalaenae]